jgi:diguanylate cyclase (GGDEF)-like protein/PAS domain S-box-containing protein
MPKPSAGLLATARTQSGNATSGRYPSVMNTHGLTETFNNASFFENAHFGVYRVSLEGQPLTGNRALAQLHGYDAVDELFAGEGSLSTEWYVDAQRRQHFLDTLLQHGNIENFESEIYRHKTRERIWVSEDGWLVCDNTGQPLYYEGTIEDITPRKEQERFQVSLSEMIEETLRLGPGEQFYQALLRRAVQIIPGAQAGSILLFDNNRYRYVATVGFDLSQLSHVSFSAQDMPRKHQSREPFILLPKTLQVTLEDQYLDTLESSGRLYDIQATLNIPIVLGEQPLAFINLDNFERTDAFGDKSLALADSLAKQLVSVLGHFQLERATQQRQDVLEQSAKFHHSLVEFISASLKQGQGEDFYARLLQEAVQVVPGAQAGSILLKRGERFHFVASEGFESHELARVSFALEELQGDSREPFRLIPREVPIVKDPERRAVLDTAGRVTDIKISLSIPIARNDDVVAFLFLDNFETKEAFSDSAIDMSRIFAEQIGVLLSRFELERNLSERQNELATWGEFHQGLMQLINDSLQQGLDQNFYQRLLERAVHVVPGAQMGSIMIRSQQGNYEFVASVGFDLPDLQKVYLTEEELFLDTTHPVPQLIRHYDDDRHRSHETQEVLETSGKLHDIAVTLGIPIWTDSSLAALLFLDNLDDPKAFHLDAIQMAEGFAKQVAILLKRLSLEQELRERQNALSRWSTFHSSLIQFSNEALRRGETTTFYHDILDHAASVIPGVEAGSILQRDSAGRYHFVSALNFDLTTLQHITLTREELYFNRGDDSVFLDNEASYSNNTIDPKRLAILRQAGRIDDIGSTLSAAVMIGDDVVAVLNLNAFHPHAFSLETKAMAQAYTAQIGVLLQRLDLEHELEKSNLELAKLANYDALTELPNRALFADRLEQAIAKSYRQNTYAALVFLDLDGFKLINDSLGHSVGDELLKSVADRLLNCVREDDTVARLGGDEFTIILSSLKAPHDTIYVAEKVLHALSQPFVLDGRELHIGASIGITVYPDDGGSVEELVQHADTAMYHAKALGKNRYHFFTSELNAQALEQLKLENDMRRGLTQGEFSLVYQPRVQLRNHEVTSLEALARWHHPELGNIPPGVFIPIAEKSNFIQLLGREVLRQACQQAKHWQETGYFLRVAVNVSVKQLQQGTLIEDVQKVLAETNLDAKWLELEITESAAMTDVESNIGILRTLRDMGVYISVDDFGTAYSSLNYLKRLPVNSLKIDKSFVEDISDTESADTAIVQAVIALGKSLGFSLIAEGVEDNQQLSFLRGAGCDEAQGYWFAKPMSVQDTLEWFSSQSLSSKRHS